MNLAVEPEDLLDWDAPLSQQREKVRKALEAAGVTEELIWKKSPTFAQSGESEPRGVHAYRSLGADKKATQALRAAGIPGLRYLDQGSRATSGGEILGVTKGDKGWQAKIRVQNRGGVGFQTPTTTVTTSKPFKTEAEAQAWASDKTAEGSRNIVLFSDELAEILERNGMPVKPKASSGGP